MMPSATAGRSLKASTRDVGRPVSGRPVLLDDPKRRAKVLEALAAGSPGKRAAQAAGVVYQTLRSYLISAGEDDASAEKVEFLAAVAEAEAKGFRARLDRLKEIGMQGGDLQAAMRSLDMQFRMGGDLAGPGGPSVAVDLDEDGRPTRIRASVGGDVEDLSDDEIARKLEDIGG